MRKVIMFKKDLLKLQSDFRCSSLASLQCCN